MPGIRNIVAINNALREVFNPDNALPYLQTLNAYFLSFEGFRSLVDHLLGVLNDWMASLADAKTSAAPHIQEHAAPMSRAAIFIDLLARNIKDAEVSRDCQECCNRFALALATLCATRYWRQYAIPVISHWRDSVTNGTRRSQETWQAVADIFELTASRCTTLLNSSCKEVCTSLSILSFIY